MIHTSKPRAWAVAVLAVVLAVAGCASSFPPSPSTSGDGSGTAAPAAAPPLPAGRALVVSKVVDGDTVDVGDDHGTTVRVRVLGIDTPETKDPRTPVQCWGPEASAYATQILLGQHVTVVTDPSQDLRDRYGRLLAYLYLPDGQNYSIAAAAAGTARAYTYDTPVQEAAAIAAVEASARSARRGLWGPPCNGQP
jgi:micrococcal nuclease